jgi:hypothetical protein
MSSRHNQAISLRLVAFCLVFLFTPCSFAQGLGTIVGAIADPSGAVVANAKVIATESETGVAREAVTDTSGT